MRVIGKLKNLLYAIGKKKNSSRFVRLLRKLRLLINIIDKLPYILTGCFSHSLEMSEKRFFTALTELVSVENRSNFLPFTTMSLPKNQELYSTV